MIEQPTVLSIETRLDNWASSARGRYDAADAALVDHAWRRLAPHHKELLRMAYQWHAGREVICRRLKIPRRPWHSYELELATAKLALVNQLAAATSS
ncbi:MAG: hypothetical protein EPN73_22450 [Paraburkholderia sp.]|uniref:hypothetical protein n=1 Tax=Paraburkholderia sp. TaxID=1926495 RepID=UPI001205C3FD|nr:hypothetical protein [Paraburkholderia sp.]TAL93140.1 MAG: hypothetical protein EPN73_22450 [Paraburkholderia sp.]